MIVVVNMKNVTQQGETYYFRMAVPKDCIEAVGKKEISLSLKTRSWSEAEKKAAPLRKKWKAEFKKLRCAAGDPDGLNVVSDEFEITEGHFDYIQHYRELMQKNLPALIDQATEDDLCDMFTHYRECISNIQFDDSVAPRYLDLEELGETGPLFSEKTPGQNRRKQRALIAVLEEMMEMVSKELGEPADKEGSSQAKTAHKAKATTGTSATSTEEETDILKVAELLIQSKSRVEATNAKIRAEVRHLKEWTKGKGDITAYTKKDLIDYIQNCLPHIPAYMHQKEQYKDKTLKQCVALTQKDPKEYSPISYKTCENTLMRLNMVFNFAKESLGVIPVNPVKGIEIPKVDQKKENPKALTGKELEKMWKALADVCQQMDQKPSCYWVTVLCLYHGFRLNEPCSLFLKDVYQDEDGIWVIDLNEDGEGKTLKNESSVRIVPIHPFVLKKLGFKAYVEEQKKVRGEGLLFNDLTLTTVGYKRKMTQWFAKWKKAWLADGNSHKNFHSLRHTFTRQAQNQAKMSDRCCQEITGHTVEGVSAVHLSYSGRLTPKTMLEELQKLEYGWENKQMPGINPPSKQSAKKKKPRRKKQKPAARKKTSK